MKTYSRIPDESGCTAISCPVCGSDKYRDYWKFDRFKFVKCTGCGLVYQNPQPVTSELIQRYDEEYFQYEIENEETFLKLMELGLKDVDFFRIEERLLSDAGKNGRKPVFLDVGCATGMLISRMETRGWQPVGVEVCRPAAEYGIRERGLSIRIGTLEDAGFQDDSVDVLHCSHLIEHLSRPDLFIQEAARIIRPGGFFIIVTPNISGFQAKLFGSGWRSAIADHMFLFSTGILRKMLKKSGFEIVKTATWGGLASGTAPLPVKKAADVLAKKFGCGDVVCILSSI